MSYNESAQWLNRATDLYIYIYSGVGINKTIYFTASRCDDDCKHKWW